MDPNAALARIADALHDKDFDLACQIRTELIIWLGKGGFSPNWQAHPTADDFVHAVRDSGVRRILANAGIVNDHAFYRK